MYRLTYEIITVNGNQTTVHAYRVEDVPGSVGDAATDYECRSSSAHDLGLETRLVSITPVPKKKD